MAQYAKPLANLIRELSKLPGIGGKSAQRLAFHILSMDDREAEILADSITRAKSSMKYCSVCGNLTDKDPCDICSDERRDHSVICVVEQARDVAAMELHERVQRRLPRTSRSDFSHGRDRTLRISI